MSSLRVVSVLSIAWCLSACTIAPGMSFSDEPNARAHAQPGVPVVPITSALIDTQGREHAADTRRLALEPFVGRPAEYRIGPSDVLSIIVWDHPELVLPSLSYSLVSANAGATPSGLPQQTLPGYVVNGDGDIQFPYVGRFRVVGMTVGDAQKRLSAALVPYISRPQLTLRVVDFRSKRVYVDGEVRDAGVKPITDVPMTLAEALSQAGGIAPSGDASNVLLNRGGVQYRLGIPQLLAAGLNPSQVLLRDGDAVRVVSRDESKVFVVGEVTKPVSLTMHDSRLSLNEALGEAGGVSVATSDAKSVFVIRAGRDGATPSVFQLDARSPVALALAEQFQLEPKDVVFVDATGFARLNRVVSQILTGSGVVYNLTR
ncbi:polysaccharide biosynthesis/export family protein [Burkholderia plantarii]|uniref:polysaccharide biosynthesis/export family protein n=1 Tax=Burkholderia plantarii TaxID=41899 RepID=UPI00272B7B0F|nr:polysaccharide biosynthesis/export family protein [Burkholderia plantarii]WLE62018.1 polysaccharide biosynthesis/export family protein [Burkholderia plantarii]